MSDPQVRARYDAAGFGRPARRGTRPAVVVVDFQVGFTDPNVATGTDLTPQLAATSRLLHTARDVAAPVILTTITFPADAPFAWLDKSPGLSALRRGSRLVEIDPRIAPLASEPVVSKTAASAFFGTELGSLLVSAQVDTVLICGATTSGCVRATAVDSVQYGFSTLVVDECVGDRARQPHDAALFDLHAKYADVVALDDACGYLHQTAHTVPEEAV